MSGGFICCLGPPHDVDIASSEYRTRSQKLPNTVGIAEVDNLDPHVALDATIPWAGITAKARAELERGVFIHRYGRLLLLVQRSVARYHRLTVGYNSRRIILHLTQ